MIKEPIRDRIKEIIADHPEGVTLKQIHFRVQSHCTKLQVRLFLDRLKNNSDISFAREERMGRKETYYYPFNGQPRKKKAKQPKAKLDKAMLDMNDFKEMFSL